VPAGERSKNPGRVGSRPITVLKHAHRLQAGPLLIGRVSIGRISQWEPCRSRAFGLVETRRWRRECAGRRLWTSWLWIVNGTSPNWRGAGRENRSGRSPTPERGGVAEPQMLKRHEIAPAIDGIPLMVSLRWYRSWILATLDQAGLDRTDLDRVGDAGRYTDGPYTGAVHSDSSADRSRPKSAFGPVSEAAW